MPGLNGSLIGGGHQTLNSSKNEKSERNKKWHWPQRWFRRKRTTGGTSADLSGSSGQKLVIADASGMVANTKGTLPSHTHEADVSRNLPSMEEIVQDDMVCLLCLQVPKEWFVIRACGCKFCLQCMEMYAHCSVRSGDIPITCPDGHCPLSQGTRVTSQLTRSEVRQLVPNDVFPLYLRLQLNIEVADNPTLVWCPRPGCETVCNLSSSSGNVGSNANRKKRKFFGVIPLRRIRQSRKSHSVVCPSCQHSFCSQCKTPWHANSPCPSLSQLLSSDHHHRHNDSATSEQQDPIALLEREGRIKRCPFCQVPIERDDGCAQMMCKHCRHVFCWFCLASLDDDFMLRHYDSGPCRSRLGHSRVSVVWHRTQVVSAFLGLGVLFLVTSPLLLLASPCFLCWRRHSHKTKRGYSAAASASANAYSVKTASQDGVSLDD